jgi:ABC-2 type transport system permease protein
MNGFLTIVRVSLRQLLGRKWVILVGLVGLLPAVVMFVQTRVHSAGRLPSDFSEGPLLTLFLLVLPLTSILIGSTAMGEERRDGTLSFLVLRPLRRETIAGAKLTAAWMAAWLISGLSGMAAAVILGFAGGEWRMVIPVLVATGISTLAYVGVFMVIGYLTRWAVLIGAGFLFFWETGISNAAASLANISLFRIGLTAYVDLAPPSGMIPDDVLGTLQPGAGGAILKGIAIGAIAVTAIATLLRRRDIA